MPDAQKIADLKERVLAARLNFEAAHSQYDRAKAELGNAKRIYEQLKKALKRAEKEK